MALMSFSDLKKAGKPFAKVKTVVDCSVVVIGLVLSLLVLRDPFRWIREGTVLSALVTGRLVSIFRKLFGARVEKLACGKDQ